MECHMSKKKKVLCQVEFDAHTMKSARDIKCRGPVMNRGNTPHLWRIEVTVVTQPLDEEIHDTLVFTPPERIPLRNLNVVIGRELTLLEYDRNSVKHLKVKATIL